MQEKHQPDWRFMTESKTPTLVFLPWPNFFYNFSQGKDATRDGAFALTDIIKKIGQGENANLDDVLPWKLSLVNSFATRLLWSIVSQ